MIGTPGKRNASPTSDIGANATCTTRMPPRSAALNTVASRMTVDLPPMVMMMFSMPSHHPEAAEVALPPAHRVREAARPQTDLPHSRRSPPPRRRHPRSRRRPVVRDTPTPTGTMTSIPRAHTPSLNRRRLAALIAEQHRPPLILDQRHADPRREDEQTRAPADPPTSKTDAAHDQRDHDRAGDTRASCTRVSTPRARP